jgi:zinc protease
MERTLAVGDYEQEAIESWQERFKSAHKLQSVRANEAWGNAMAAATYGPEHDWTLKGSATGKTISNLGRDAAKAWAKKHFVANNATLTLVGSFDPEVAKKHIAKYMGAIPSGKTDPEINAPFQASGSKALGVVKKKDPQTTIQIRYRGPVGINEDELAARMILGQMLNQRMSKLRTKLGSTYGAYAGIGISNGPRAYQLGGSFDTLRVGESLTAMRKEVNDLRQGMGFNLDFVEARRTLLKKYLAESVTTGALASKLGNVVKFKLGLDYSDKLVKAIATATPAQVKIVMAKDLNPKNEVIGIFGDKETIEKAFKEAGIEDAEIVEPE